MVDQLDLPEPEDLGKVHADREQAHVKSRGRRLSQQDIPKRNAAGHFRRQRYSRRSITGVSPELDSCNPVVPSTGTPSRAPPSGNSAPAPAGPFKPRDAPSPDPVSASPAVNTSARTLPCTQSDRPTPPWAPILMATLLLGPGHASHGSIHIRLRPPPRLQSLFWSMMSCCVPCSTLLSRPRQSLPLQKRPAVMPMMPSLRS